jgi:type I restriction enzyme, S subunit
MSALDEKISINKQINIKLDALAKTLYDFWFVQFDFPDANGKPYKTNGGKMIWSEELKREIPDGWVVKKLSDWIERDKSGDWGNDVLSGNFITKVNCIRGADINGLNGLEECAPPIRYILEKNSNKILSSHDLIIEISGGSPTQSTGRFAYITEATLQRFEIPLICSNFCKAISLKNQKLVYNFAFHWDSLYKNNVFFGHEGKTSGIKNLLFESFVNSHWTAEPNLDVAERFYAFMHTIDVKKQDGLTELTGCY